MKTKWQERGASPVGQEAEVANESSRLIAEYENGTTYFIHGDSLGSTRLLTAMNKSIFDSLDYLPFGEQIAGDTGTTHKFTGKERDSESGLDNFGARYNSSSMGRLMSPDPIERGVLTDAACPSEHTWVELDL
jgi:RHS repeat-associated protein